MQAEEYASLGTTKFENKDYLGAIACFDAALQLDLTNGTALFGKGVAYYHLGDRKAAEAALTAAIPHCPSDPAKVFASTLLGDIKQDNGDYLGAIACYDAALQIDPSYNTALFGKRAAYRIIAEAYTQEGLARLDNENYQGAIACYDMALRLDPWSFSAYFGKGDTYGKQGDGKAAETALNAALPLCPNDPSKVFVTILLGDTKLGNGDNQGATACYDAALRLDSSQGAAYFGKGLISYNLGDDKAAEDALSAAIRLCPDTGIFSNLIEVAAAYALRCTSRLNLNDRKGAWEDYKKVFSLDKQLAREIRILAQTCVGTSQLFVYFTMHPAQATMILRLLIRAE